LAGNVDGFMNRLKAFFSGIPYELNNKEEKHYQTVFYLLFQLMGQFVEAEQRSAIGRADAVVTTADTVFVFEFKLTESATAEEALQQIDNKNYLIPFTAGNKKLVKVGATFSAQERTLDKWKTI
jgi:Holliday junction resolvase-like predicted endonuclease